VNTYSGATTISAGTIQFNNNAALSTGTVTLGDSNTAANNVALLATAPMNSDNGTIGGGAIANNIVVSASGTGTATIGTTTFAGSGNGGFDSTTFTGTLTLNRATTLQSGDSDRTTFTGVISGNVGTLTVDGGARVLIGPTADNTFTGNVQVTGSGTILQLGGSNNTLNGNSVDLGAGTTLYVTKDNGAESIDALTGSGSVSTNGSVMQTLTVGDNGGGGTYSGVIDDGNSTLAILKSGAGTQVFTGASTYSGGTEVSGGTLQLGDGSTTGASLGSGTVLVDSKGTFTLNLASGETFSNAVTDNGHVIADDSPLSNYTISSIISGSGDFTKSGGNTVTVTGANTYQGGTTISGGTLRLGDGVTTGAALGTAGVTIDNNATLTFALASGETFSNGITDNGHIIADFRVPANNYTIASNITGSGDFTKNDANTVTLTGNNSYQNGTTINGGTLLVNNTAGSGTGSGTVLVNASGTLGGSGTISGPVTLNGTVSPGAGTPGTAGTTLHTGAVTWNGGGALNLQLGAGTVNDMLAITGALTKGTTGTYTINITNDGATQPDFTLATYSSTNFLASDFSLALPSGFTGALAVTGTQLDLLLTFAGSGNIIENAPPIDTPLFADFTVNGPVYTAGGNNTIRTLTFTPGSSLQIFDTLYVTQGPVILVNGATITLNGNLSTSELELLYGSLLNGNGSILGDLINGGVVSPGHSPGIIRVSGNYTQLPAGLLKIEIGGQNLSQHDLLGVNGTARLGGTLQLVQLNNFKLQRNDSITFLTANGGVIGRFDNVVDDFVTNTIIQPTVVYSTHGVALEGQQGSFKKFAVHANLPPNVQAVGGMLDSAVNDRRANSLINYLDARILSKLPEDLAKISPDALTSVFTIGTSLATVQSQNLQRRTDDLRSGASGFNAANLAINGDGPSFSGGFDITTGVAGPNGPLDDGKEVKEMKQVAPAENRWGAFLSGTGDWVSVGDTNNARGYELESGGFTLGVDYKVCPNFAIGLMAGYTGTTSDLANNGRVYVNGGKVGVYATTFVGGWYADVAAFGGYDSYDTRRAGLLGDARGSTEGGNVNALFGTGYDFKKGGFTFGPTASFNYTYVGTSAFNEYGSLAPLDIHGGGSESLRSAFGIKASYDWKVGGVTIKPEVRAAWQHEYGDAAYGLDASLASGAGSSFTVNGPQLGRDSALIGAGFAIQCSDRVSTYFYYDGELGRKNYESNAVTGGIRLAF
jgi:autotransporter-associated beta strand protein